MKKILEEYRLELEGFLQNTLQGQEIPQELIKAMQYSLMAGGKRIRPVLCLIWAELLGQQRSQVLCFASSLELIHTYSLVHDDLPAMDNDDLRRGKPSNHKQFGEALAILAGDGLLTEAFALMLRTDLPREQVHAACLAVVQAAGPRGMVGGQVLDISLTGKGCSDVQKLKQMHSMKTGALIESACVSGALLAGAGQDDLHRAKDYGQAVGLAFQVADDILDLTGDKEKIGKPVGSDQGLDKLTYPALLGLDKSRQWAQELVTKAQVSIADYHGPQAEFLHSLAQYLLDRTE